MLMMYRVHFHKIALPEHVTRLHVMYQYTTEQKYMYYLMNKLTFQPVTGIREPFSTLSYTTNALNNAFSSAFWYLYVPSGILVAFRYFGAFRYLYGPGRFARELFRP